MTISERNLKSWRREALAEQIRLSKKGAIIAGGDENKLLWATRILQMTQVLLDQHLLKGEK